MAATAKDRVDAMLETYLLALAGLDQCPESAPQAVKDRLTANVERAERVFVDAAADGMRREAAPLEDALRNLATANTRVRDGLHEARPILTLVNELERATALALEALGAAGCP